MIIMKCKEGKNKLTMIIGFNRLILKLIKVSKFSCFLYHVHPSVVALFVRHWNWCGGWGHDCFFVRKKSYIARRGLQKPFFLYSITYYRGQSRGLTCATKELRLKIRFQNSDWKGRASQNTFIYNNQVHLALLMTLCDLHDRLDDRHNIRFTVRLVWCASC